jgi:hypothetical protein
METNNIPDVAYMEINEHQDTPEIHMIGEGNSHF